MQTSPLPISSLNSQINKLNTSLDSIFIQFKKDEHIILINSPNQWSTMDERKTYRDICDWAFTPSNILF
ncbi:hypothetical protein ENUP19_0219G0019 [Entamoeba nuttalli]|uniref:Uncharacterized protein n=1 Tax=Entamoeba nuttalli TaxID=412467 RepID=A0ABQ0DPN0_9EUKA